MARGSRLRELATKAHPLLEQEVTASRNAGAEAPQVEFKSTSGKEGYSRRRLDECPDLPVYTVESDANTGTGTYEGSYSNPIDVVPGCPLTLEIAAGKSIYLSISGFSTTDEFGSLPMAFYSWRVDSTLDETPVSLFSFRYRPTFGEPGLSNRYDWYYWPLLHNDAVIFREDLSGNNEDY